MQRPASNLDQALGTHRSSLGKRTFFSWALPMQAPRMRFYRSEATPAREGTQPVHCPKTWPDQVCFDQVCFDQERDIQVCFELLLRTLALKTSGTPWESRAWYRERVQRRSCLLEADLSGIGREGNWPVRRGRAACRCNPLPCNWLQFLHLIWGSALAPVLILGRRASTGQHPGHASTEFAATRRNCFLSCAGGCD